MKLTSEMAAAVGSRNLDLALDWELDPEFPGRAWPKEERLSINGLPMHCYALRVLNNDDGIQVASWEEFQSELEALQNASGDAALCTVSLDGLKGTWIIVILPHGE